ncbi:MAG: hypothetical protein V2A54_03255 [Bacteroidota bacterium]
MSRIMTPVEKERFRGYFQNLNVDQALVSGESTKVYNCISWTVGVTTQWLWPGSNLTDFDTFYMRYGLTRAANGQVAAWGHASNNMTHGCISGIDHGPRWESKCGSDLKIQHDLNELTGNSYGRVIAFYTKTHKLESKSLKLKDLLMKDKKQISKEEIALINEEIIKLPKKVVLDFETNFTYWKKTWFKGLLAIDSNPTSRVGSLEFFRLVDMGEKIVPLVIQKLMDEENFFALQLYERLQKQPNLLIEHNVNDDIILEGEQGRAFRTVKTYFKNK